MRSSPKKLETELSHFFQVISFLNSLLENSGDSIHNSTKKNEPDFTGDFGGYRRLHRDYVSIITNA